jgi:hypothetical protein
MKNAKKTSESTKYHAVHDQNGNIRSIFRITSSTGAQGTIVPSKGHFVSQVNLDELKLSGKTFREQGRALSKLYRVDTSTVASFLKKTEDRKR